MNKRKLQFYVELEKSYITRSHSVLTIYGLMPVKETTARKALKQVKAAMIRKPGCLQINDPRINWGDLVPASWEYIDFSFGATGIVQANDEHRISH